MLRSLVLALLLVLPGAQAGIWPDQFGVFTKVSARPVAPPAADRAIWEEYGLEEAEEVEYASGTLRFSAVAWRLKDPTSALAAFQWQRPPDAEPSEIGRLAAATPQALWLAFGNYLFRFQGRKPEIAELAGLFDRLPRLDQSSLPTLTDYLPKADRTPNSERFVIGPASLERFEPRVPPSVAAFHYGTEAQLARYRSPRGEMSLALFSYPTPHIARERLEAFQKLDGAIAKRAGPLIAVIFSPPDPDAAERLLARVQYRASLSWSELIPSKRDDLGDLILTILALVGVLVLIALAGGLVVGGVRWASRAWFGVSESDPMIRLHLEDRAPGTGSGH
ncbi:MAG: DUF6599 family protein [Bryobacterales bacterium]|nr:hypothetical protein [Bryobacteraceae bacterium]MDW8354101.1 DUF6599 family protein [Bryobacterales bacterium]